MYNKAIIPFSATETNALQTLFRKYDIDHDGRINEDEFKKLILEFATRP
jgi:Ca2+-binding EF-hand superfamily protein